MKRTGSLALLVPLVCLALATPAGARGEGPDKPAGKGSEKAEKAYKCPHTTQECLDMMAAGLKKKGWLGITYEMDEATAGLRVTRVVPDSPARKAGILEGDILVALNGQRFADKNEEALRKARDEMRPGNTVAYTVSRQGAELIVKVTLASMPEDVMAQLIGQHMLEHAKPPAPGE